MDKKKTNSSEKNKTQEKDYSGKKQIVRNVIFSWGSQLVLIISGFIVPRIVNDKLGQESLGLWDFSWTIVSYFSIAQVGITSSVNRFIGKYWGNREIDKINKIVSSSCFCLGCTGLLLFLVTFLVAWRLPQITGYNLGENVNLGRYLVICFGVSISMQTILATFNGVLTGCHRWDLKNINQASWHFIMVMGFIISLSLGGNLYHMGAITLVVSLLSELNRTFLAVSNCPGLSVKKQFIDKLTIKELYTFGGKTLLPVFSVMLQATTVSMIITNLAGFSALAIFNRPRALLRHVETLVRRMTMILIPTVSYLQDSSEKSEIDKLTIKTVRYTLYLIIPIVSIVSIFGGTIISDLWMNDESYSNTALITILSLGLLPQIAMIPLIDVLVGLNAHGSAGTGQLIASLISAILVYFALGPLGMGLAGAAFGLTFPLVLLSLIYYPILYSRYVGQSVLSFYKKAIFIPTFHLLPYVVIFLICRLHFKDDPMAGMIWGMIINTPIYVYFYWKIVLPEKIRNLLLNKFKYAKRIIVYSCKS